MRPIRLVVEAFGPFVEKQELDFSLLCNQPLFLLTGPTGSGKTMLLDAICYALFGECSSETRGARSIRSDHATMDQPTRVVFDFALGSEVYRIERSPEQERAKRRGSGTVCDPAKATLWRAGEALETQAQRATERIREILGFTSAQFRQVVVLPQGEFKRFLDAKSGEREEILEVLFQTSEYRRIEEALTARAAAVARDWEIKKAERDMILRQAEVASRENLEAGIERLAEAEKTKQAGLFDLRKQAEAARASLERARDDDRRLKDLRDSQRAYDAIASGAAANEARKHELDLARRAARVLPPEREAVKRSEEAAHARRDLNTASNELNAAAAADGLARAAFEAEERRQPERDEAARVCQQLDAMRGKVRDLDAARADVATAHRAAAAAAEDAQNAEGDLKNCVRAIEAKRAEQDRAARHAEPVAQLTIEVESLTRLHQTRKALEADQNKLAAALQAAAGAREQRAACEGALGKAREKHMDAERRWIEGQASLLAGKLVAGQPCPVCGSVVHPAPAHGGETVPGDTALKRARAEIERLEQERDHAAVEEHAKSVEAAKAQAAVEEKRHALGDSADLPAEELANSLARAQRELKAAQSAATRAAGIRTELERLSASERELRAKRDEIDAKARSAAGIATAREEVFKAREAEVPEELRAEGALERAIGRAQSVVAALERSLKHARDQAAKAAERLAGARTTEQAKREAAERASRTAEEAHAAFDAACTAAGFQAADVFRSAVRPDGEIDVLDRLIRKFQSDFAAAESRLLRARDQAESIRPPDLAALNAAGKQATERLEACVKQIAELTGKIDTARKQLDALDKVAAESGRLEKRHGTIARIAEAANGRNAARVNFQRFVQATLLDRVLEAATARLRLMSRGRYELQRAAGTLDRRASAGLDLEVFDAHTGAARPVSTLSGGESFQASLALALGLAGVVQNHAGGLRLESIFIDEGFGSLDADALSLAMDTLRDLQQGGRLIGIVSHVAELKEQIPARLEVKPGRRGSQARFVLN